MTSILAIHLQGVGHLALALRDGHPETGHFVLVVKHRIVLTVWDVSEERWLDSETVAAYASMEMFVPEIGNGRLLVAGWTFEWMLPAEDGLGLV